MTRAYNRFTPSGLIITFAAYGVAGIQMLKVANLPVASTGLGWERGEVRLQSTAKFLNRSLIFAYIFVPENIDIFVMSSKIII